MSNPIASMLLRRGLEAVALVLVTHGWLHEGEQSRFVSEVLPGVMWLGSVAWTFVVTQRKRKEVVAAISLPKNSSMAEVKAEAKDVTMAEVKQVEQTA